MSDDGPDEPAAVLFVKIYTMVLDDPDMMCLSFEAFGLWALMLTTAKRAVTDGFVSHAHIEREALGRQSEWKGPLTELEAAGAIDETVDGWVISGWAKYNKSVSAIGANRRNRSRASQIGNHTRYCINDGRVRPDCPICHGKKNVSPDDSLSRSDRTPVATPIGLRSDPSEVEIEGEGEGELEGIGSFSTDPDSSLETPESGIEPIDDYYLAATVGGYLQAEPLPEPSATAMSFEQYQELHPGDRQQHPLRQWSKSVDDNGSGGRG